MLIAWDNKVDAASLVAGSELPSLPGANVLTQLLSQKWGTAEGVKSSYLTFNMKASVGIVTGGPNVQDRLFRLRLHTHEILLVRLRHVLRIRLFLQRQLHVHQQGDEQRGGGEGNSETQDRLVVPRRDAGLRTDAVRDGEAEAKQY